MDSMIKTFSSSDGQIQRVQIVRWDDWQKLDFLYPKPSVDSFERFCHIYRAFLVPAFPWVFGQMVLFQLPDENLVDARMLDALQYGKICDPLTAAAVLLRNGVRLVRGKPVFRSKTIERLWRQLESKGCLQTVCGKLPYTVIIPVGRSAGYLTGSEPSAALKVNANFFIMDSFDCATVYDHVGVPIGLCVRNGVVEQPPLYQREALIVHRDGTVGIMVPELSRLAIEIGGVRFVVGKNAELYTRPSSPKTPNDKRIKLVIVGRKVVAVKASGSVPVPTSGFVLATDEAIRCSPDDSVIYHGMEEVVFGIQVGNSILRDGVKTDRFLSPFYNIRKLQPVPYPPSLYPMDFRKGRAARIALGADENGKPMLVWAEGAGKLNYTPGQDSSGASLAEMAEICEAIGMINAINLDGGGSAQILLSGMRQLRISDRTPQNADAERPIPLGLVVRDDS